MYCCPYCGKELNAENVFIDTTQSCRLSETRSGTKFFGGKTRGIVNWDGIYDACRDGDTDTKFICGHCNHELSEIEVEDLILINAKERPNAI